MFASLARSTEEKEKLSLSLLSTRREQRSLQLDSPSLKPPSPWPNQPTGRPQLDRDWVLPKVSGCPPWSRANVPQPNLQGDKWPSGFRCSMTHRKSSRYRWVASFWLIRWIFWNLLNLSALESCLRFTMITIFVKYWLESSPQPLF